MISRRPASNCRLNKKPGYGFLSACHLHLSARESIPFRVATQETYMARSEPRSGIATRRRGKLAVLAAVTILCLYFSLQFLGPFLPAVVWGVTIAILTRPLVMRLGRSIRHEGRRALVGTFIVGILIYAPVATVGYVVTRELTNSAAEWGESQRLEAWLAGLEQHPQLGPTYRQVARNVDLGNELRQLVEQIRDFALGLLSGSLYVAVQSLLTLLLLFFLYRDGDEALRAVRRWLPLNDAETDNYFRRVDDTVHATVIGTFTCAALQGFLGGLMFRILGLPAPVLWGTVMGLLSVIPYAGSFVVWAPVATVLVLSGAWGKGLILAAWGTVAIGLIDNLTYPYLVGKRLRQHSFVALVAVVGGVAVFGATGLVLGPLVMATTFFLLDLWRRRTSQGTAAEDAA
jgi:predicted PurR-regulated permease PerM